MYPVFLSSICDDLLPLRTRIFNEAGDGINVYVDEQVNFRPEGDIDHLETVDELIKRIREADIFVLLLGGARRHSSSIHLNCRPSNTSFVEIELFQAALLQKQVRVLIRNDFSPEPNLEALLQIIKQAFPHCFSANHKSLNDNEIVKSVRQLVYLSRTKRALKPLLALRAPIRRLVQAFYTARVTGENQSPILFLTGAMRQKERDPNEEILSSVFGELKNQPDEEKRLSRIWIGLREFMGLEYRRMDNKQLLQHWSRLFSEWAKSSAWYGLHGDTPLGCLAALNSMRNIRERLASLYRKELPYNETSFPGGPLASAKYSIAKHLYIKSDRDARLKEALQDLNKSLVDSNIERSGLLAIRGSIYRRMGRISEAVEDYEEVLRLRRKKEAPSSAIGEALSELGYGYLRQGRISKALDACKSGVELLREGYRAGFLARGLRKLSVAYLANGRFLRAYETRKEAQEIAHSHGALDQS